MRTTVLCLLALAAVGAAPAPAPVVNTTVRTGAFQARVTERSRNSAIALICARMGWGTMDQVKAAAQKDGADADYDLSKETFEAYIPRKYDGSEPYGLLVWVSAGPTGHAPEQWLDVLDKHKLIWVGPNKAGNNRSKWVRCGLAIDAAEHMQREFKIDPLRVYVSGGSGGGRTSSTLAMAFPDVFTGGGYPIIGCNYFRRVDVGVGDDGRTRFWQRAFERPTAKLLQLATKERRFVLLTGDNDGNREQTQVYYEAMKKDGFKYVTYIQVPGMGHQTPNAEWFEKGIVALDEGRDAIAKAQQEAAQKQSAKADASKPDAKPVQAAARASDAPNPDDEADKLMRLAKLYLENRLYTKAREKLNQLVKDYPSSPHVQEAKKILKEIGTK
jgi:poly(3-hydroxybutyrate) depolymerase